jgi:hypothetical protein
VIGKYDTFVEQWTQSSFWRLYSVDCHLIILVAKTFLSQGYKLFSPEIDKSVSWKASAFSMDVKKYFCFKEQG